MELVQLAVEPTGNFKRVGKELGDREPCEEAARYLCAAYRQDRVPAWLAAYLLGQIGHRAGYATARAILEAGLGALSEGYTGCALARIAPQQAETDLAQLLHSGSNKAVRSGAASGLGKLGTPNAVAIIIDAIRERALFEKTASSVLEPLLQSELELAELLRDDDPKLVRTALLLLEARCTATAPTPPPTQALQELVLAVMDTVRLSLHTRRHLLAWFGVEGKQAQ